VDHLDEISVEELQDALDNVEEKRPTQRLLAAIGYKNGVSQAELAEWYGVQRHTIYNWLKRLDTNESLEHAVTDAHRSGRKRKLSESQQKEFEETVHDPLEEVGIDEYRAELLPEDKQTVIEAYQADGRVVAWLATVSTTRHRWRRPTSASRWVPRGRTPPSRRLTWH
jgi:transposase